MQPKKRLEMTEALQAQIFLDKEDMHDSEPLHRFILRFLIEHRVAGATAIRAHTGFGSNYLLKEPNKLFSFDEPPMVITFIDSEQKVTEVLTALREIWSGGLITTHPVKPW